MRAVSLLGALGCAGGPEPRAALPPGWVDAVARSPEALSEVVDADGAAGRSAWVALHRGAYAEAAAGPGAAGLRGARALSAVEADLAATAALAWPALAAGWRGRGELPEDSALPTWAALVALDAGQPAVARALLEGDEEAPAGLGAAALAAGALADLDVPPGAPAADCLAAHQAARREGRLEPLSACPAPLLEAPHAVHDPLQHATRAAVWGAALPPPAGLSSALFSAGWACEDPARPACAAPAPLSLASLGPADDPEAALQQVAALDGALADWEEGLREEVPPEGLALLDELQLVTAWRARALAHHARAALDADRPRQAAVLLRAARDHARPREVGPTNPPELFSLLARAAAADGRPREALDALAALRPALPHTRGLVETLGDWAVLDSLSRRGDSKER